jgi:hypothetical protein
LLGRRAPPASRSCHEPKPELSRTKHSRPNTAETGLGAILNRSKTSKLSRTQNEAVTNQPQQKQVERFRENPSTCLFVFLVENKASPSPPLLLCCGWFVTAQFLVILNRSKTCLCCIPQNKKQDEGSIILSRTTLPVQKKKKKETMAAGVLPLGKQAKNKNLSRTKPPIQPEAMAAMALPLVAKEKVLLRSSLGATDRPKKKSQHR